MPGLSSRFASRHSSSRCRFAGGPSRRAASRPSTRCGHSWLSGRSPDAEHVAGVVLGFGPAPLQQPQPRPHPELPRAADRGVPLLADLQRVGNGFFGFGEATLLDIEMAQVAHRGRGQVVEPVPQADVGGGEQVGPRAHVAVEQPGHATPDGRGGAQHPSSPNSSAIRVARSPARRASAVSPRWAARKEWLARAKPSARRSSAADEDLDGGRVVALGESAIGRVPGEVRDGGVRGADRDDVAQRPPQLQGRSRAAIASWSRSVR